MITHASLFSGIGAADLAAEELGWRNVFNCEINEFCRRVLDYHFPDADKYKDIYKVNFRKYEGTINVLSGGFPCQSFSVAGRRKGTDDDRYLWPQMLRAITEIKPDYVLGENVVGILSMVSSIGEPQVAHQASLFGEGDNIVTQRWQYVADIIREDLEREGYTLQIFVIPACAIGAPHQRNRVWFIAKRNAANTESKQCDGVRPEQPEDSRTAQEQFGGGSGENGGGWTPTNSDSHRGREVDEHMEPEQPNGAEHFSDGREWDASDTSHIGTRQQQQTECEKCGRPSFSQFGERDGEGISKDGGICGERWRNFPTVSPVHRGNDGIPFDVDCLTISFGKWRTESLKAYGNSMVMPLVKEIFKAIQKDIEHDREIR